MWHTWSGFLAVLNAGKWWWGFTGNLRDDAMVSKCQSTSEVQGDTFVFHFTSLCIFIGSSAASFCVGFPGTTLSSYRLCGQECTDGNWVFIELLWKEPGVLGHTSPHILEHWRVWVVIQPCNVCILVHVSERSLIEAIRMCSSPLVVKDIAFS